MADLTTAQKTHIRYMSGDNCAPYDVPDEYMQYLYDTFGAAEPLCLGVDPLGSTIVWVLRARVRKAAKLYNETNAEGGASYSQKYQQLNEQLMEAEAQCGFGTPITIGALDLGLDAEAPAGSGDWWYPWSNTSWWPLVSGVIVS